MVNAEGGAAKVDNWAGLTAPVKIGVVDYHAAGQPFRIVTSGLPVPSGARVHERMVWLRDRLDGARRLLVNEPRGHGGVSGGLVVPAAGADSAGREAVFGAVFFDRGGYPTVSAHGTIALATWAVDAGVVACPPDGDTTFAIDVPAGRLEVRVYRRAGRVSSVTLRNLPVWVAARGLTVPTSRGSLTVDIAYAGAFYAVVRAADAGLTIDPSDLADLIAIGGEVARALEGQAALVHPSDDRLSGLGGTLLTEDLAETRAFAVRERAALVSPSGVVDRSPGGAGLGARLALLEDDGRVGPARDLEAVSIIGTRMAGRVLCRGPQLRRPAGPVRTVLTELEGQAHLTGRAEFILEPDDELGLGFHLD